MCEYNICDAGKAKRWTIVDVVFFYLGSVITPIPEFWQKKWSHLLLGKLRKPDVLTWVGAWQLECWYRTACQSHVYETLNLE